MVRFALSLFLPLALWPLATAAQTTGAHTTSGKDPYDGATVLSRDDKLVGAVDGIVDEGGKRMLVVGLAGYLGVGEKDVIIPAEAFVPLPRDSQTPRHFNRGEYGGSSLERIKVSRSIEDLISAQAYRAKLPGGGTPSPHAGTPAGPAGKPPSSTQSGGPG